MPKFLSKLVCVITILHGKNCDLPDNTEAPRGIQRLT